jgi:hypothetical protein
MNGLDAGPVGINMNDRLMNLVRGWFVFYENGTMITEDEDEWSHIKKSNIKVLGLKWQEKMWTISGKTSYIQFKRGSVGFSISGCGGDISCEERCIGFYDGNKKVIYRVNDRTGRMTPEVRGPEDGS